VWPGLSIIEMNGEKLTRFCCGQADRSMAELKSEVGWGIISLVWEICGFNGGYVSFHLWYSVDGRDEGIRTQELRLSYAVYIFTGV